jgi:hypothetical protein
MLLDVKWKSSDSDETHRVLVSYTQEFRSDSGYGVPNWYMIFQQKFIRRTYSCFRSASFLPCPNSARWFVARESRATFACSLNSSSQPGWLLVTWRTQCPGQGGH